MMHSLLWPPGQRDRRIALASQSPRRAEILQKFHFEVEQIPTSFDESSTASELKPEDHVIKAARGKALGASHWLPIVAGDTIVVIGGQILGKPRDLSDAARMLRLLSGRTHEVWSAVALRVRDRLLEAVDRSQVEFRRITDQEINAYVHTAEPMGKAGAYAIQGRGAGYVVRFSGCYWNIVGFPIEVFLELWKRI